MHQRQGDKSVQQQNKTNGPAAMLPLCCAAAQVVRSLLAIATMLANNAQLQQKL